MADGSDVFDRAAGKKDPEFHFVVRLFTDCSINCLLPPTSVLRMDALEPQPPSRRALFRLEAIDAIPLVGEMQGVSSRHLPDPATGMREPLGFSQIRLALPLFLFSTLAFGNLMAQILIRPSQFRSSLSNAHFKPLSGSSDASH